ncbi:MAG: secretin N-terminal domain-containing protein [Candidatus Omnitrophota bacterium]|nr:secretin N-terminal domain-containing protein [Candidatus Omnitrophota bacterium]
MNIAERKFRIFILFFVAACLAFTRLSLAEEAGNAVSGEQVALAGLENVDSSQLLDIDYRDVDIKDIARAFSEISGKNIIISDDARAKVTLKMSHVNWKTAMEVILDTYNLAYIEKGNFIIITSLGRRNAQEESGALETKIIRLNFSQVSDVQGMLSSLLSSRGKTNIDIRTNSLIITDIKERVRRIEEVALQLDINTPQVLIEALIIDVKLTDNFKWGVLETLANNIKDPNAGGSNKWKVTNGSVLSVTGGATAMWGNPVLKSADLDFTLQSIITNTEIEILANPRIVTLDNLEATIDIVTKKPYQTTGEAEGGGTLTTTEFLDIGIKLGVTPHITKDNFISVEVNTEYGAESGNPVGGVPVVANRKATTNVMVKDGETIVLGGLRRRDFSLTKAKIPILGDIPLLGNLFKSHDKSVTETELVIFITPHLIGSGALTSTTELMQVERMNKIRNLTEETVSFQGKELLPIRPPVRIK